MCPTIDTDLTMADLVAAYTGEDINGIDPVDYRQLRDSVMFHTTQEERDHFFATGQLLHPTDDLGDIDADLYNPEAWEWKKGEL